MQKRFALAVGLLCCTAGFVAPAGATFTFEIDGSLAADPGDLVTFDYRIADALDIVSFDVKLQYDPAVLVYQGYSTPEPFWMDDAACEDLPGLPPACYFAVVENVDGGGAPVGEVGVSGSSTFVPLAGTPFDIVSLVFRVSDEAPEGDTSLSYGQALLDIVDPSDPFNILAVDAGEIDMTAQAVLRVNAPAGSAPLPPAWSLLALGFTPLALRRRLASRGGRPAVR